MDEKKQQAVLEVIVRQRNDALNRCALLEAELAGMKDSVGQVAPVESKKENRKGK
jgi:hypothetical protein